MTKVIVDTELRAKLHNLETEVALCDEKGQPIAHVLPEAEYRKLLYAWAKTLFSREEIEAARAEPGGMPTAEAIAYLEKVISDARDKQ